RVAASGCATCCEPVFSTGRFRVLTRIEQAVEMDHEIAHVGVVDGLLRLGFPGGISCGVIGKHADDIDLVEVLERRPPDVGQFASDDEVKQLLRGTVWHGFFPNERCPASANSNDASTTLTVTG